MSYNTLSAAVQLGIDRVTIASSINALGMCEWIGRMHILTGQCSTRTLDTTFSPSPKSIHADPKKRIPCPSSKSDALGPIYSLAD